MKFFLNYLKQKCFPPDSSYWHCIVDHESSLLTTFSTMFGRYHLHQLPFGLSVSSEIFQKRVHQALEGLSGVFNIADDILVYGVGNNEEEATADRNRNLEVLLQRCCEHNIALNRDKLKVKRKLSCKVPAWLSRYNGPVRQLTRRDT